MTSNLRRTLRGYHPAAVKALYENLTARHADRMNGLQEELVRLQSDNERLAGELVRITSFRRSVGETHDNEESRDFGEVAQLAAAHAEASVLVEEQTARLRDQRARHEADKAHQARLRADALARLETRLGEAQARWRGGEEDGD
ncbi:hypothetical protein [Paenibacillus methanolicus]|uniref:Uncharacterized protein n=1 Tax=Paenibacillus methanolicus TaxID=582686 RepID=A0A5S5BSC7_9BACL|nr:hypothetical protein [Paenibacillus methanolicus]TYP70091.1 hypothetical protein BCM02_11269 [Paenibacillus methanolicus]